MRRIKCTQAHCCRSRYCCCCCCSSYCRCTWTYDIFYVSIKSHRNAIKVIRRYPFTSYKTNNKRVLKENGVTTREPHRSSGAPLCSGYLYRRGMVGCLPRHWFPPFLCSALLQPFAIEITPLVSLHWHSLPCCGNGLGVYSCSHPNPTFPPWLNRHNMPLFISRTIPPSPARPGTCADALTHFVWLCVRAGNTGRYVYGRWRNSFVYLWVHLPCPQIARVERTVHQRDIELC